MVVFDAAAPTPRNLTKYIPKSKNRSRMRSCSPTHMKSVPMPKARFNPEDYDPSLVKTWPKYNDMVGDAFNRVKCMVRARSVAADVGEVPWINPASEPRRKSIAQKNMEARNPRMANTIKHIANNHATAMMPAPAIIGTSSEKQSAAEYHNTVGRWSYPMYRYMHRTTYAPSVVHLYRFTEPGRSYPDVKIMRQPTGSYKLPQYSGPYSEISVNNIQDAEAWWRARPLYTASADHTPFVLDQPLWRSRYQRHTNRVFVV